MSQSVRTPQFRTMYLAMVVMGMPLFQVLVFLVPFARSEGIGGGAAGLLIGIVGAASVVGRLGLGAIGGRFGSIRMFKVSFAIMALSYPIWLLGSSYAALVLFAVTMGLGYGGYIALSPAVAAELWGVAGLGGTVGALYTAAAVSALVGAAAGRRGDRRQRRQLPRDDLRWVRAGRGRGAAARPVAPAEYRAHAAAVTCWPPATRFTRLRHRRLGVSRAVTMPSAGEGASPPRFTWLRHREQPRVCSGVCSDADHGAAAAHTGSSAPQAGRRSGTRVTHCPVWRTASAKVMASSTAEQPGSLLK